MAGKRVCVLGIILVLLSCHLSLFADGQLTDPQEVEALREIRGKLEDPLKKLRNWGKGDPCSSNWTGVICSVVTPDGYHHVQELRLLRRNLSGILAPELGELTEMTILDFMWNSITGSIPKEIGKITKLQLLLLSGNKISGPLPDELGFLPNLSKFQLDLNYISGPIPKSFVNLTNVQHFHMNDNSFDGQIPPELSTLPRLIHFLLDNNKLTGYLPAELARMPSLRILQLDNNNFGRNELPSSFGNMPRLIKLSLRNCNLTGTVPDFVGAPRLNYLDLSQNHLSGNIPTSALSVNVTTIDLSNNMLNGSIPDSFSSLPRLQRLSLQNNILSGSIPTTIWQNITFSSDAKLLLEFQNNLLSDITGSLNPPPNVTIVLQDNPVCQKSNQPNIRQYCGPEKEQSTPQITKNTTSSCSPYSCHQSRGVEYVPGYSSDCFCAAPFGIGMRLRSPSFSDFLPYKDEFIAYITSNLGWDIPQFQIDSIAWQLGPRLRMYLKVFPKLSNTTDHFNETEVQRIANTFATFAIAGNDFFGPYDLLNFTLQGPYANFFLPPTNSGMSKGAIAGIVLGSVTCAAIIIFGAILVYTKKNRGNKHKPEKFDSFPRNPMKIEGVKGYYFKDLELATNQFSVTAQIGQGGYGKVYRGILTDGTVVAIKRAVQGSLQGEKEFFTEIEFLSRLHHRNLVPLVGYCDEEGEQMLVYEFMPNGSLHDLLNAKYKDSLTFAKRLTIALDSAKGILYLHTEADPPIIHRDIKANNILLDKKFTAKVSDFGISKLAPVLDAEGEPTSHVSTVVKGTPGYLDPEYFLTHKLTDKSDVYSIGIVFLELLTGRQPIAHGKNIVREVNTACQAGLMSSIIDRSMGPYPADCVKKFMALALRCAQDETHHRPSMLEIVRELENISAMVPESKHFDVSSSAISESHTSSSVFTDKRNPYVSMELTGSDLISGVIPTINPR